MCQTGFAPNSPLPFSRQVALVCAAIPPGRVASYGQIALLCGHPRAARQVGGVLARGRADNAHRVVNRAGVLSGAAAFLVPGMQAKLLEAEGVCVGSGEQVDLSVFGWQPTDRELAALACALGAGDACATT